MESKFLKFVNDNKWFVVFYLVWTFIHLILYFASDGHSKGFWPFRTNRWESIIDQYGFLELFVYLTLPLLIFVIIILVGKDIKKVLDENK